MRILIYPHSMELGGSQLNAIELACGLVNRGHEAAIICEEGPLVANAEALGLRRIVVPVNRRRPSASTVRILHSEARAMGADVIHGFEWPPAWEAWAAAALLPETVATATVMSMDVAGFLPHDLPLTVGTTDLVDRARRLGMREVRLLEPPVDTDANTPDADSSAFRTLVPDEPGILDVVVVSRLASELKLAGLMEAVDAVAGLPSDAAARLVVVGDGPAREALAVKADLANAAAGREVVVLAGQMADPRGAYAAATVSLGMGGSALRAASAGRPVVVQGERGFWRLLTPASAPTFSATGWFGIGPGDDGSARLQAILIDLLTDPSRRAELGAFGRTWVTDHYDLSSSAERLEAWYEELLGRPRTRSIRMRQTLNSTPAACGLLAYKLKRRHARARGDVVIDDFNAVAT